MLRTLALIASLVGFTGALAESVPAHGPLALVFLTDIEQYDFGALGEPASVHDCTHSSATCISVSRCAVDGATLSLTTSSGESATLVFGELVYMRRVHQGGPFREYRYRGTWSKVVGGVTLTSPVELMFWHYEATPDTIRGSLSYQEFGVTRWFQAARRGA